MTDRHPETEAIRNWLRTEGRFIANADEFYTAYVERLRDGGLPIVRFTTGVPSLHPQVDSFSTVWERDKGLTFQQVPTRRGG